MQPKINFTKRPLPKHLSNFVQFQLSLGRLVIFLKAISYQLFNQENFFRSRREFVYLFRLQLFYYVLLVGIALLLWSGILILVIDRDDVLELLVHLNDLLLLHYHVILSRSLDTAVLRRINLVLWILHLNIVTMLLLLEILFEVLLPNLIVFACPRGSTCTSLRLQTPFRGSSSYLLLHLRVLVELSCRWVGLWHYLDFHFASIYKVCIIL